MIFFKENYKFVQIKFYQLVTHMLSQSVEKIDKKTKKDTEEIKSLLIPNHINHEINQVIQADPSSDELSKKSLDKSAQSKQQELFYYPKEDVSQRNLSCLNHNQLTKSDFAELYRNSIDYFQRKNTRKTLISYLTEVRTFYNINQSIKNLKDFRQNKVYNLMLGNVEAYFGQFSNLQKSSSIKLKESNNQSQKQYGLHESNADIACSSIQIKNQIVVDKILKGSYEIFYRPDNVKQVIKKLEDNIGSLRKSLSKSSILLPDPEISVYEKDQQIRKRKDQVFFKFKSNRKKGSWKDEDKQKQIQSLLADLNHQKSMTHDRYEKSLQNTQMKQKLYFQNLAKSKAGTIRKNVQNNLNKHRLSKHQYEHSKKLHTQKSKEIQEFLQKFKAEMPIYEKYLQKFHQQQQKKKQQDKLKLKEIHQQRKAISLSEFLNHQRKITKIKNVRKQTIIENLHKIKEEEKSIKQNLRNLFHGKYHQKIKEAEIIVPVNEKQIKKQRKEKSFTYSVEVVNKHHKTIVEHQKRQQIQKILQKYQHQSNQQPKKVLIKRKKSTLKPSSITKSEEKQTNQFENLPANQFLVVQKKQTEKQTKSRRLGEKSTSTLQRQRDILSQEIDQNDYEQIEIQVDSYKIGKEYLKQLRLFNEGKLRKKKHEEKSAEKEKKVYDYSKQKKNHYKIKLTLSAWKKVLENSRYRQSQSFTSNYESSNFQGLSPKSKLRNTDEKKLRISSKKKYQLLQPFLARIEADTSSYEKQKKQIPLNDLPRAISINQKLQKCYIQSIKSKLQILKE